MPPPDAAPKPRSKTLDRVLSLVAAFIVVANHHRCAILIWLFQNSSNSPRERSWPSLWVHRAVAWRAVKVVADNLKAFRNTIRMCVPSIRLRKPGCAGLSTDGTPKIFSPTVEDDHPLSMTLRRDHSPVFFPTTGVWVMGQFDCQRNPA